MFMADAADAAVEGREGENEEMNRRWTPMNTEV